MDKFLYILFIVVFMANTSSAQIRLYGKVTDTQNATVDMATVVLKDNPREYHNWLYQ